MAAEVEHARVVVIGGGALGCSLLYHLCLEGWTDVALVEKGGLTSGSTWHAAGQLTKAVGHYGLARMSAVGLDLYPRLEAETGQSCTWHGCGSLRIARDGDEEDNLWHQLSVARAVGFDDAEVVSVERARELHPFYDFSGVRALLHTPGDGHVDPAGVAFAQAKGARTLGGRVLTNERVLGVERADPGKPRGEWRVRTEKREIVCEHVVNASGSYAIQVSEWVGIENLPLANMLHHYLVTDTVPEFVERGDAEVPVVRDDWVSAYIRQEQKSGLIGIYEKGTGRSVWDDGTPWEEDSRLFDPEYDRIALHVERAMEKMPIYAARGIKRAVVGVIVHSDDGQGLVGPSGVPGFWQCCGVQVGIAAGAGTGRYLAQWMVHGSADIDMRSFDPRRHGSRFNEALRVRRVIDDYHHRHVVPYPALDHPEARPEISKTTPVYNLQSEAGAVFQNIYGWERPAWYATAASGLPREHIHSFRRSALHGVVAAEAEATRAGAGICDLSPFSKVEVSGPDAAAFLERVSSNRLPREGRVSLTYFIEPNGRIAGEATAWREGPETFHLSWAAADEELLLSWLRAARRDGERVRLVNHTESMGALLLTGPSSRRVLGSVCEGGEEALSSENFPWLSGRVMRVLGEDGVRALRVSYAGELGWELHHPFASMRRLWTGLLRAGRDAAGRGAAGDAPGGLALLGTMALDSMRMEKAYKAHGELTNEVTLAEAGQLRFARREGGFQGAEATAAAPGEGRWRLALARLDEPEGDQPVADPVAGGEAVWPAEALEGASGGGAPGGGAPGRAPPSAPSIGMVSSCAYGHAVGAAICWAWVSRGECAEPGARLAVRVLGSTRLGTVLPHRPLVDPDNERLRA